MYWEADGKLLFCTILNRHPFTGEIKRRPEVKTLLVTKDNRTDVMRKTLSWLTQGEESSPSTLMSLRGPIPRAEAISSPLMGEDSGEGDSLPL